MEKRAKIADIKFKSEWDAPNGATLYIHEMRMVNGDEGNIYCKSQYPPEIAAGKEIMYTIDEKKKFKIIRNALPPQSASGPIKSGGTTSAKFADIVNYAFSYAKDITVARITAGEKVKDPVNSIINEGTAIFEAMNILRKKLIDDERNGITPNTQSSTEK